MKFEAPRGTHDILPADAPVWRRVTGEIERLCALYGYPREERWPPMTNLEGFTTLPPWWRAAAGAAPTHDSRDDIAARKTKA